MIVRCRRTPAAGSLPHCLRYIQTAQSHVHVCAAVSGIASTPGDGRGRLTAMHPSKVRLRVRYRSPLVGLREDSVSPPDGTTMGRGNGSARTYLLLGPAFCEKTGSGRDPPAIRLFYWNIIRTRAAAVHHKGHSVGPCGLAARRLGSFPRDPWTLSIWHMKASTSQQYTGGSGDASWLA